MDVIPFHRDTREVNWLAAYALGLAFAVPASEAEARLRDETDDPVVLRSAAEAVASLATVEADLRLRAARILAQAASSALVGRTVPA